MTLVVILVALAIALGLVGVVVPLLPGSALVGAAILVWAVATDQPTGWVVLAIALGLIVAGVVVKYLVPGRRLQRSGVPGRSLLAGAVVGVVGFFVIPVVGLPLGFVGGIYLAESLRVSREQAWPATRAAVTAVGLGILIELGFATTAALVWAVGVVLA